MARKLGDATYYVSRRIGRAVCSFDMIPNAGTRLALLLSPEFPASEVMIRIFLIRRAWVPMEHSINIIACQGAVVHPWMEQAANVKYLEAPYSLQGLCDAAQKGGCSVIALAHCLEDRAAHLLSNILLEGRIKGLEFKELTHGLTLVRPCGGISMTMLGQASKELGLQLFQDHMAPWNLKEDIQLLEDFLAPMPGQRLDLLTNIATASSRVQKGYLA